MAACGASIRDRSSLVSGFGAGGGALAVLFYMIRIFAKVTVPAAKLGFDDLSITLAVVRSHKIPSSIYMGTNSEHSYFLSLSRYYL